MELRQALQDVARVYIAAGGDKEVNLSAATKARTRLLVEQHDPCSFEQAAKEIYKLTLTDIWPRFLLSPEFLAIAHRKELRVLGFDLDADAAAAAAQGGSSGGDDDPGRVFMSSHPRRRSWARGWAAVELGAPRAASQRWSARSSLSAAARDTAPSSPALSPRSAAAVAAARRRPNSLSGPEGRRPSIIGEFTGAVPCGVATQ